MFAGMLKADGSIETADACIAAICSDQRVYRFHTRWELSGRQIWMLSIRRWMY